MTKHDNPSPDLPAFHELSPEDQQLVRDAETIYEFFRTRIGPRLQASSDERERFARAPSQYLVDAGCPVLPRLSQAKLAEFDDVLAKQAATEKDLGCWFCTKGFEVAITAVVVIGAVLVAAVLAALVSLLSAAAALAATVVLGLIEMAGIAIGAHVLAPHVWKLATLICQEINACAR